MVSSSETESEKNDVQEEPLVFLDKNDNIKNTRTITGFKSVEKPLPKPMEGLTDKSTPPFLKKTYEMVEDPKTDSIISWSETKKSFVVWDCYKFETRFLPKHFKHDNFFTFVRRLNYYGFRKVDCDRWEFANESFQQGKKHLLKCIQGKKPTSQTMQHQGAAKSSIDNAKLKDEAELEKLRADQNVLRTKVLKLTQQQENTQKYLAAVNERLHSTELKQKGQLLFMIKTFKNPAFVQTFIEEMETNKSLFAEGPSKKRRLLAPEVGDGSLMEAMETADISSMDDDDRMHDKEELATNQSEIQTPLSFDGTGSPQERKAENLEMNSASDLFVLWEKLMEDDMIYIEEAKSAGQ